MCPLLNGNEYKPQGVQGELSKATEELFLIRFTGQVFRDYECAPEPPIAIFADLRMPLRVGRVSRTFPQRLLLSGT